MHSDFNLKDILLKEILGMNPLRFSLSNINNSLHLYNHAWITIRLWLEPFLYLNSAIILFSVI